MARADVRRDGSARGVGGGGWKERAFLGLRVRDRGKRLTATSRSSTGVFGPSRRYGAARAVQLQASAREEAFQASLAALRETLEEVKSNLREVEEQASTAVALPPFSGLNFSKRSHALRMCRRGETPERIAASLALPKREVELLVKIHQLLSKP